MVALKRLWLVIFVLAAPALFTWLLYIGTGALLASTNRVIDPEILRIVTIAEFITLFVFAAMEVRDRWSS